MFGRRGGGHWSSSPATSDKATATSSHIFLARLCCSVSLLGLHKRRSLFHKCKPYGGRVGFEVVQATYEVVKATGVGEF